MLPKSMCSYSHQFLCCWITMPLGSNPSPLSLTINLSTSFSHTSLRCQCCNWSLKFGAKTISQVLTCTYVTKYGRSNWYSSHSGNRNLGNDYTSNAAFQSWVFSHCSVSKQSMKPSEPSASNGLMTQFSDALQPILHSKTLALLCLSKWKLFYHLKF